MNGNQIKKKWRERKIVIAGWSMIGHPDVALLLAQSGVDAVVLDWQHGVHINEASIVICIESIFRQPGVAPLVRVPSTDRYQISHVLDAGACGILVAMVNTAEEAQQAVNACRYAPTGGRSLGMMPHQQPRESIEDYVVRANQEIICIVMIETKQGVENIEEICDVQGLDGIYIGPYDLSLDMGIATDKFIDHPQHLNIVTKVFKAARQRGIATGHHGFNLGDTIKWIKMGSMFCQLGSDTSFVVSMARSNLDTLHNLISLD
jgi:4-hydroxy-2-oxoheptanedioate aldolase